MLLYAIFNLVNKNGCADKLLVITTNSDKKISDTLDFTLSLMRIFDSYFFLEKYF